MNVASRTTEGQPVECPICEKQNLIEPSRLIGDAVCAHCGSLIITGTRQPVGDDLRRLSELGLHVETDEQNQISRIAVRGHRFNDTTIGLLVRLNGVPMITIAETWISRAGVRALRKLLPDTIVVYENDDQPDDEKRQMG